MFGSREPDLGARPNALTHLPSLPALTQIPTVSHVQWYDASMANTSAMDAASDTNTFLALNGSFNLYMV